MIKISHITTSSHDLGLRSISAYLKKEKLPVSEKLFAFTRWGSYTYNKKELEACVNTLKRENSDYYFFTIHELDKKRTLQLAEALKKVMPEKQFVVGGDFTLSNPEECVPFFDYVVQGEGEIASKKIILGEQKKGLVFFPEVKKEDIQLEDYDLPLVTLSLTNENIKETNRVTKPFIHHQFPNKNGLPITTQRGCSYNCSYCGVSQLRKRFPDYRLRKISLDKVVNHLAKITSIDKSINYIYILDEDFLLRREEEIKIFSENYQEKVKLPFFFFTTPSLAIRGENKLRLLAKAGANQINIGIQTGSERIGQDLYNRIDSNEEKINASKLLVEISKEYALEPPMFDFIILNPYEEKEDMIKTIELIEKLPKPFRLVPHSMNFFGGTPLKYKALEDHIIDEDYLFNADLQNFLYHSRDNKRKNSIENIYFSSIIYRMWGVHDENKLGSLTKETLKNLLNKDVISSYLKNIETIHKENSLFPNPMSVYPTGKF